MLIESSIEEKLFNENLKEEFLANHLMKSKKIMYKNCIICDKPPKVETLWDDSLLKCNSCNDIRTCKDCFNESLVF